MFRIDISTETADALVRDILLEDYRVTKKLLKRLEDRAHDGEVLGSAEMNDMMVYEDVIGAFETLLNYYMDRETFLAIMGKEAA